MSIGMSFGKIAVLGTTLWLLSGIAPIPPAVGPASIVLNGTSANGMRFNGLNQNGIRVNGLSRNGTDAGAVVRLELLSVTLRDGDVLTAKPR